MEGVPCIWHCHPEVADSYGLAPDIPDHLAEEIGKAAKRRAQAARRQRAEASAAPAAADEVCLPLHAELGV